MTELQDESRGKGAWNPILHGWGCHYQSIVQRKSAVGLSEQRQNLFHTLTHSFEHADGEMLSVASLSGSTELVVEAELSGGEGESSWQHTQLFRRSLKELEESSFEILIDLENA